MSDDPIEPFPSWTTIECGDFSASGPDVTAQGDYPDDDPFTDYASIRGE